MSVCLINPYALFTPTVAYIAGSSDTSSATTYNFTLGTGTSTHIVIGVVGIGSANRKFDSATVDGSSATVAVTTPGATQQVAGLAIIANTWAGASKTFSITFSGAMLRVAIMAWEVNVLTTTPLYSSYATATGGVLGTNAIGTVLFGNGPPILVSVAFANSGSNTVTWSDQFSGNTLTEDVDTIFASSRTYSGASARLVNDGGEFDIYALFSTSTHGNPAMASAIFY